MLLSEVANVQQTTIASRAAIRFDTKPLVSWSDNLEPLTRKSDGNQRTQLSPPEALKSQTSISGTNQYTPRFPISNLAPVRVLSPEPYNPPTPPPDPADDSDAMDWTPSRQPLQPNFHLNHHQPTPIPGPSPFQGQLPPAPKPLSWQLRNPGRVPAPKPLGMPPNPFHMAPVLQPTSNQPQQTQPVRSSADMVMAPPRFFPESDLKAETGLESLFDKAFSIADSPARKERSSMSKANDRELHINKPLHILKSLFLALCLTLWVGSQSFGLPKTTTETVVLSLSFLVAGFSLLELLMRPMIYWKMIDILLSLAQLVGCVYLALIRTGHFGDQATFDKAGIYLVAFFTGQEIFGLRFMFSAVKPKKVTKQPVKDKKRRPSPPPLDTRAFSISSGERTPTRSTFVPKPPANTKAKSSPAKKQKQPVNFKTPAPLQPLYSRPSTLSRDGILNSLSMPEYPPPTLQNSFSGLTQSQLLSSSFGSTERFMSPTSTASVTSTDYASTISEPPSPELAGRHRTPGPSIMSLSLDDSPAVPAGNTGPAPRYSLRSRRR